MKKFLKENNFENIDFLYNNSFFIGNKIITGTRGWVTNIKSEENLKILKRENDRLKLSIEDGIKKYKESIRGSDIINNESLHTEIPLYTFIHYPPFFDKINSHYENFSQYIINKTDTQNQAERINNSNIEKQSGIINKSNIFGENVSEDFNFIKTMQKYHVKKCFYAHLHGESHKDAIEGNFDGIEYKLVSSDYLGFDLMKIE